jgi:hypothetical protein
MARKVKNRVIGTRPKAYYRSAALSSGGMAHQIYRDVFIFDVWGRKLAAFRSSSTVGISWLSASRWFKKHTEAGVLIEKPWPTTLEDIALWVKARKSVYEELDEAQRKDFAAACIKNTHFK